MAPPPVSWMLVVVLGLTAIQATLQDCPLHDGPQWEKFNGSSYYFEMEKEKTWDEAGRDCFMKGASLVSIHSQQENDYIYQKLIEKNRYVQAVWTGIFYSDLKWKWTDFSHMDYQNWGPGEPNNWEGRIEDCAEYCVLRHNHAFRKMWNDVLCNDLLNYVCKAPKLS